MVFSISLLDSSEIKILVLFHSVSILQNPCGSNRPTGWSKEASGEAVAKFYDVMQREMAPGKSLEAYKRKGVCFSRVYVNVCARALFYLLLIFSRLDHTPCTYYVVTLIKHWDSLDIVPNGVGISLHVMIRRMRFGF